MASSPGPDVRWRDAHKKGEPDFLSCYQAWQGKRDDVLFQCQAAIPTLEPVSPKHYVGWDLNVPDQYRADFILRELRDFEARGQFPSLVLICLPNDHTSGTKTRMSHPGGHGGRQRPGVWPPGGRTEPLAVLAADGHLRHRRRSAGRLGPRERFIAPQPSCESLCAARRRG